MLDAPIRERVDTKPQDMAHASASAPTPSGCRPAWYVVATYPKAERRAHAALHHKGYQPYLPLITVRLPNRHYHTSALFPGYLFIRLSPLKPWYPIRYAPGVFHLLTVEGKPHPCRAGAVEALQALEAQRATPLPESALWAPGMPCSLGTGPFEGHLGMVLSVGREMALVSLMLFGALREVSVGVDCLRARDA
jgi:transcriptional antiterminator RfaH